MSHSTYQIVVQQLGCVPEASKQHELSQAKRDVLARLMQDMAANHGQYHARRQAAAEAA